MRKSSLPSVRRAEQTLVRQSVEMTFARYDYTAIEKRIRYVITYLAFQESQGKAGEDTALGRVEMDEYHQRYATIPIRILIGSPTEKEAGSRLILLWQPMCARSGGTSS